MNFPGYALGGFSVGETPDAMARRPACRRPHLLPGDKPRYLMGVGRPEDLLAGVAAGIDMFDCVMPTRNGRNAVRIHDEWADSVAERLPQARFGPGGVRLSMLHVPTFSRAYLHHLFLAEEMLGPTLLSLHNVAFYLRLMAEARHGNRRQNVRGLPGGLPCPVDAGYLN